MINETENTSTYVHQVNCPFCQHSLYFSVEEPPSKDTTEVICCGCHSRYKIAYLKFIGNEKCSLPQFDRGQQLCFQTPTLKQKYLFTSFKKKLFFNYGDWLIVLSGIRKDRQRNSSSVFYTCHEQDFFDFHSPQKIAWVNLVEKPDVLIIVESEAFLVLNVGIFLLTTGVSFLFNFSGMMTIVIGVLSQIILVPLGLICIFLVERKSYREKNPQILSSLIKEQNFLASIYCRHHLEVAFDEKQE